MPRLIRRLFDYFENLTTAFPAAETVDHAPAPNTLWAFFRYHLRGYHKSLILLMLINVIFTVMEVSLFAFMGKLVDWLAQSECETFLQTEGWALFGMGFMLLVLLPLAGGISGLFQYQALMGNFPMAVRGLIDIY